jgi:exodeoxyribonuclease V alpha subunit
LILLGDRNQLASVEAGAVMGDLCDTGNEHKKTAAFSNLIAPYYTISTSSTKEPPLADCIVELTQNYRFTKESGINTIGCMVQQGNAQGAWNCLVQQQFSDCVLKNLPAPGIAHRNIGATAVHFYSEYLNAATPLEALTAFDVFRVLCAVRKGPYGVEAINATIEQALAQRTILRPDSEWYHGRPIMITANNYELNLYNGDIGIIMKDPAADNELKAFFIDESSGNVKAMLPQRLPSHETVFAMTVHKAQGSEFNRVLLLLPAYYSPVLSRELMYTGITRAKAHCELWSNKDVFMQAAAAHTIRMSGLRDALWK